MENIKLDVTPIKCLYPKTFNPTNDFYIYSCKTDSEEVELNRYGTITIKGKMQRLDLDVTYKAEIAFGENHPTYGVSYNVISVYQELPKTTEAQKDYLRALITENQIYEIYKIYGDQDIIKLFKEDKIDYKKIKGFGEVTYKRVRQKIVENLDYQELLSNLGKYGITYDTIVKLMKEFGSAQIAIQKVKNNPYTLTRIHGIGFKKADAIARNMAKEEIELLLEAGKINKKEAEQMFVEKVFESPFRIQSGIRHVIEQEQGKGNTYIEEDELLKQSVELLQVEDMLIQQQIKNTEGLHLEGTMIALENTYKTEEFISSWIKEKLKNPNELNFNVEEFIERMEEKHQIKLSHQQKSFFYNVKNHSVHLLVGYAGCGKSKLQSLLRDLLKELGLTAKWLAPTGNAAKILSGYIGEKASTAHKAIGYGQNKEEKDLIEIIEDYIIIDETSMLDVFINASILKKIKNPEARILFIGDAFQIPSVQCGNLLHDMLESGVIPTTKLDIVFRQSEGGILDIATKIRLGEKFIDNDFNGRAVYGKNMVIHCTEQEWMSDGYKYYYNRFLDNHKPEEIMVLSPTKKGKLGTITINKEIQQIVNPSSPLKKEIEFGEDGVLRIGDYVINIKNTYDIMNVSKEVTEIVNGDKGIVYDLITDWNPKRDRYNGNKSNYELEEDEFGDEEEVNENGVYVKFDSDEIKISLQDKFQLLHAWCLTMHKSQGGNAKAVLIICDKSHKFQMSANLLYTAVTRATDYVVIVCQADVINHAMRKVENLRRNTRLEELLRREVV
ncbi:AAA family ATPase [Paenibacillus naphthalenovorans]|uniref:ATP-dependent RecD-like DNA helicase n=1 Tax=Paenibacillus naphthalenovorans TaxID=162209 RepID=A0A0U2W769_9BACL|nr:AAA family ATPase [Paenibacillus naphthalenovorans]ALS22286.1 ATP-dependent RecD-like DNA helicase [Paenibacillus naphthalenovorans]